MNERLQRLEEKIAYLERHVTAQDKAMLEMADDIVALRRELAALRGRTAPDAGESPEGQGGDWGERPPHY